MVFAGVRLETAVFAALTAAPALAYNGVADLSCHIIFAQEHLAVYDAGAEHSHAYVEKCEAVGAFLRGKEILAKGHAPGVILADDGEWKLLFNPLRVEILPGLPVGNQAGSAPVHVAWNRCSDTDDLVP